MLRPQYLCRDSCIRLICSSVDFLFRGHYRIVTRVLDLLQSAATFPSWTSIPAFLSTSVSSWTAGLEDIRSNVNSLRTESNKTITSAVSFDKPGFISYYVVVDTSATATRLFFWLEDQQNENSCLRKTSNCGIKASLSFRTMTRWNL